MSHPWILVVDDCYSDIELLLRAFNDEGITQTVDVVDNARSALTLLAERRPPPALVILDLRLPDMPGFDLLRMIRSNMRLRHLPVVVFTGTEATGDLELAIELAAASFFTKPVTFEELRHIVRGINKAWLTSASPSLSR